MRSRAGAIAGVVAAAAWGAGVAVAATASPDLPPLVDGARIGPGWQTVTLPKQVKPVTRFSVERVDGRAALRIDADASYGNLAFKSTGAPTPARLRWSWRLQLPNPGVDLRRKSGDDVPAKVCISVDLPLEDLPFGERQMLSMARSIVGEDLPSATLCWVWGGREPKGAAIDNPFSRRVRYLVLRNAADPLATWLDEDRDIAADFARAFGDEARAPGLPPRVAVLVGADADNTGARSVAHIADLRFGP